MPSLLWCWQVDDHDCHDMQGADEDLPPLEETVDEGSRMEEVD